MRPQPIGVGLLAGLALGLAATAGATAAEKKPAVSPSAAPKTLAWFQPKNIGRNGLRGTHTVALTFDDGPNENTRPVLSALAAYGIKATFFIVGTMARDHPDILKEIAQQGHLLGNHSATHARLGARFERSRRLLLDQLRATDVLIRPLMKEDSPLFFRAPYGYWKESHAQVLNRDPRLKFYVGPIFWDEGGETKVDGRGYVRASADWDCWTRGWKPETCAKGYLREIGAKDGGVVLLHVIHPNSADLVRAIVPRLMKEGYKFVRLDQLREYDRYKTPRATTPMVALAEPAGPVLP